MQKYFISTDPFKIVLPIVPDVQTSGKERPVLPVYAYSRGINKTNPQNISEFAVRYFFPLFLCQIDLTR